MSSTSSSSTQIIWQKGVNVYILFTRWGRIGDNGNFQHTPFQSKAEAAQEFCKIFKSKTGNNWSNLKNFEKQPKKYRLIQRDMKRRKEHKIDFNLKSDIPSKLPQKVQDLLKEMVSNLNKNVSLSPLKNNEWKSSLKLFSVEGVGKGG